MKKIIRFLTSKSFIDNFLLLLMIIFVLGFFISLGVFLYQMGRDLGWVYPLAFILILPIFYLIGYLLEKLFKWLKTWSNS